VRAVLQEMRGETRAAEETLSCLAAAPNEQADRQIGRLKEQFGPYWPVLT
jgi:hypothetical protein